MGHFISGIVTSFLYEGDIPSYHLVDNFYFLPLPADGRGKQEEELLPAFDRLSTSILKVLEDLSRTKGPCVYLETDYWGGEGSQRAAIWRDGRKVEPSMVQVSYPYQVKYWKDNEAQLKTRISERPIDEALRSIGLHCRDGCDEFDTAGLGRFRSNYDFLEAVAAEDKKKRDTDTTKDKGKRPRFRGKCNYCGKIGHKIANCWAKEENKAKRPEWYKAKGTTENAAGTVEEDAVE